MSQDVNLLYVYSPLSGRQYSIRTYIMWFWATGVFHPHPTQLSSHAAFKLTSSRPVPSSVMSLPQSRISSYPSSFANAIYCYVVSAGSVRYRNTLVSFSEGYYNSPVTVQQDLSSCVELHGTHYIAIGEHADLWVGKMSDTKVWRLV
jgi:hypothetical protein